jgi:hypothetical protein
VDKHNEGARHYRYLGATQVFKSKMKKKQIKSIPNAEPNLRPNAEPNLRKNGECIKETGLAAECFNLEQNFN